MKIMNCPLNGPRNISEFVYGGTVRPMPDAGSCSDGEWADYVFLVVGETSKETVTLKVEGLGSSLKLVDAIGKKPLKASSGTYREAVEKLGLRVWRIEPVKTQ